MRYVLDCGVLLAPGHEGAMEDWVTRHRGGLTRVRLHLVPLPSSTQSSQNMQALARLAVSLRRYDSCILPVAPSSVAWTRVALAQAGATLTTPILLLAQDMKAPAIEDLLDLGVADFIMHPACPESLRVRLRRLGVPTRVGLSEPAAQYEVSEAGLPSADAARPRVSPRVLDQALTDLHGTAYDARRGAATEPFRVAKARVVDGFERDFIRQALSRHGGNVAQAARACAKHRRAFWALMQKHGIEATPYRQAAQPRYRPRIEDGQGADSGFARLVSWGK